MDFKTQCKEKLSYNRKTGLFTWLANGTRGVKKGDVAGYKMQDGYVRLSVGGKTMLAHRVAWMFVHGDFPVGHLDHINRDKADNRISNLRDATSQQNAQNRNKSIRNTSGYKGVVWHKRDKRWQTSITVEGTRLHLGLHDTAEKAYAAYVKASKKYQTHSIFKGE